MSRRTRHLPPPRNAIHRIVRELRYHEASRQVLGMVYILVLAFMSGVDGIFELYVTGVGIAGAGILIRLWASGHVKKNRELATDGPYAYVRHPLYVGNILILTGFTVASQLWWAFPVTALLMWFYYPTAIDYEDLKLKRMFGDQWQAWAHETRALVPRFRGRGFSFGGWSLKQSLIDNGEPLFLLVPIFCAWYMYTF